jgi:hypothetical protein
LSGVAVRLSTLVALAAFAIALAAPVVSMSDNPPAAPKETDPVAGASDAAFETFLDRLMHAESDGRDDAANPRSTALGPFQFIKTTFIEVARRHFASEVANLDDDALLALRTNRDFARRAARAFSRDNLDFMIEQGLNPTFGHLRLAFLVGPQAAVKLVQATPTTPVAELLTSAVITANPFMKGMSAADLITRAARDVSDDGRIALRAKAGAAGRARPAASAAAVDAVCNPKLASCRRWIALRVAQHRQKGPTRSAKKEARPGV